MYLQNCQKLTTSGAFERVASHINESYYALDWENYEGLLGISHDFSMSIDNWRVKLTHKTKQYSLFNKPISFPEYAVRHLKQLIEDDLGVFTQYYLETPSEKRIGVTREFVVRVKEMTRILKLKPWLATIFNEIEPVFNEILTTYDSETSDFTISGPRLTWNGQNNQLTTLLLNLTEMLVPNGSKRYLSATAPQLLALVLNNFTDKTGQPFSESSLKTVFDQNRPEKRVKEGKRLNPEELLGEYSSE